VTVLKPALNTVQTAFILYLFFAGLIIAVSLWFPQAQLALSQTAKSKPFEITNENHELDIKQEEYKKSWRQILENEGYIPQAVYKLQTERLIERQAGPDKFQWLYSENMIVLPAAKSQLQLVRLTSQWQGLIRKLGFNVNSLRWGYSNANLWVKLKSSARVTLSKHFVNLPLEQLTLIQPVSNFKGRLPGLMPVFPPQLDQPVIPKIQPEPIAQNPKIKQPLTKHPLQPVNSNQPIPLPFTKKQAEVAIIIDDVGYVTGPADEMLKVSAPLTWAILPYGPYSQKYSEAAKEKGFEILLHLPLEPVDTNTKPGPGLIKRDWSDEEIINQLDKDLQQIPIVTGVNNHMGSAGTSDERLMGILMEQLKKRQLFFVDSYTIPGSVAEKYARLNKLPFAKRKVFIDNKSGLADKKAALRDLMRIALRDGQAIGIAHVREGTAQAIREMLPEFIKAGIEIVPVSRLLK
jgi:polysaccharide deacetylase 2 family uncharacterized protein YibQ